jgi:hypothetical protein
MKSHYFPLMQKTASSKPRHLRQISLRGKVIVWVLRTSHNPKERTLPRAGIDPAPFA